MSAEIIKEYLVKVGFDADGKSFAAVTGKINGLKGALQKLVTMMAGRLTLAFGAFGTILTTATLGITKFAEGVAAADLQVEILARRLLTTEKNARSLKVVMDAMNIGSIEQLQDINLNPELRQQFLQLRKLSSQLEPNRDAQDGLKNIRMIGHAFERLQVIVSFTMANVAGKLGKYLEKPLASIFAGLEKLETWFLENFDEITDQIASALANVVMLTESFYKMIGFMLQGVGEVSKLFMPLVDTIKGLPAELKAVAAAFGIVGAAILAGPWGIIIGAIAAITALIEDYTVYKMGGTSLFGSNWGSLERFATEGINFIQNIDKNLEELTIRLLGQRTGAVVNKGMKEAFKYGIPGTPQANAAAATDLINQTTKGYNAIKKMINGGGKGKITSASGVRLSSHLREFNEMLAKNINSSWLVTSGIRGRGGPRSHASGNKEDIGFAGKSDREILELMMGLEKTPGFKFAGLEGIGAQRIQNLIKEHARRGGTASKFGDYTSGRTTGPHIDILIEKMARRTAQRQGGNNNQITINVNGSKDPKAVGQEVAMRMEKILNQNTQRSAYL